MPTPQYGETIRKGLGAEKAVAENRTSNLYKAAAKNEGDILTNADELVNALKSPASFAVTKVDSPLRQYIKAIGKDELFFPSNPNAPSKPKELTMQELATLRQIVNSKWENIDDATQSQLNGLRGILNKMEANPNAPAPIYNKARIGRIVQGNKWEQPLLDKIFAQDKNYKGVYKLDNEDLFKATIKHTSLEEFTPLWARMNLQQKDLTRAQLAQEMRNEVFSNMQLNAGANRLEQGSPAKLIRYIDNVGYDKLKMIYGKDTADKVMLLQRTWKELSSSPQGTKSFGSAPEIARLHRMTLNLMRQFSYPNSQFTNILGGASIGWKLNVYDTGTTDYASIYSNLAQTTPTANPVIADADGFLASFYWTGTVDVVLTDENDNLIDSAKVFKTL
jgi:hypothetical protein